MITAYAPWERTESVTTAFRTDPGTQPAAVPAETPGAMTERELVARLRSPLARCAGSSLDPDEWFPIAVDVQKARAQAAAAIAVCDSCPVRGACLELALRQGQDVGRYGVWGGLVEGERQAVRRKWLTGIPVADLLSEP
jgi:WhiB family redox-sensing transcriptional regulator